MKQNITTTQLDTWKKNFTDLSLKVETESVIVDYEILKAFIDGVKNSPDCNAVRIYFIRYDENDGLNDYPAYIKPLAKGINRSQVSLAFVPVKDFKPATLVEGQDIIATGNQIFTLAICHPTFDYGIDTATNTAMAKGSGLCPPKCNPPRN